MAKKAAISIKNIKVGDVYRLANDRHNSWGYAKGESVVVTYKYGNSVNVQDTNYLKQQIGITLADLVPKVTSKAEIQSSIADLKSQIAGYEKQLKWLEQTGAEEYNETEFKVWSTLQTLNSDSTDIDKAKVIAKLIDG